MSDKELELQEIETIKAQLDMLGVKYHHNSNLKTLQDKLAEVNKEANKEEKTSRDVHKSVREEMLEPILVKITCLNPNKTSWRGEIFRFGNSIIPQCEDFIPYNCEEANAVWVPRMLVGILKERVYSTTVALSEKERGTSEVAHRTTWLPEFSIIELDVPKQ